MIQYNQRMSSNSEKKHIFFRGAERYGTCRRPRFGPRPPDTVSQVFLVDRKNTFDVLQAVFFSLRSGSGVLVPTVRCVPVLAIYGKQVPICAAVFVFVIAFVT